MLGDMSLDALHVRLGGAEDGRAAAAPSFVSIHAKVRGARPLSFAAAASPHDQEAGMDAGADVSIAQPMSECDQTITFPDPSGTVITTASLPNPLVSDNSFSLSADTLLVTAEEGLWLGTEARKQEAREAGREEARGWGREHNKRGFVFLDSLPVPAQTTKWW